MWTSKEYEEYGISALRYFYPEFLNMKKDESPDYFDNTKKDTKGVEITRAITKNDGEIDAFLRKNKDKKYKDLSKKQLKKYGFNSPPIPAINSNYIYMQRSSKNGVLYYYKNGDIADDYILLGYIHPIITHQFTIDNVLKAINDKLIRLNKNYKELSRIDVCIIVQEQLNYSACQDEIISDLMNNLIVSIKTEYKLWSNQKTFDNIFLLFLDNLFRIDSKTWIVERNTITQEQIDVFIAQLKNI